MAQANPPVPPGCWDWGKHWAGEAPGRLTCLYTGGTLG